MTVSRATDSETKAGVTRTRMLDAAAAVFRDKGYAGAKLTEISQAAGMKTVGSLYYHFASREDLVEAVIREGQVRTATFVRERVDAIDDASPLERLAEAIRAHTICVLETSSYTSATIRIIGQVPADIRRRRLTDQREYGAYWDELFVRAQEAGELRTDVDTTLARRLIVGAINAVTEWYRPGGALSAERLADDLADLFIDGLASRRGARRVALPVAMEPADQAAGNGNGNGGAARGAATRRRILEAAGQVFRDQGYAGTRLSDVAAVAGIKAGSLYYHFDSREALVAELMMDAMERTAGFVRRSVDALPPGATEIDALCTAIAAHLESVLTNDAASALVRIYGQVPDAVRGEAAGASREYGRYWRELLRAAVEGGRLRSDIDIASTQVVLTNALNWTAEWYRPEGDLSPVEIASEFCSLLLDGLAVRRRRRSST